MIRYTLLILMMVGFFISCTKTGLPGEGVGEGGPIIYPYGWPKGVLKLSEEFTRIKISDTGKLPVLSMFSRDEYDGYILDHTTDSLGSLRTVGVAAKFNGDMEDVVDYLKKNVTGELAKYDDPNLPLKSHSEYFYIESVCTLTIEEIDSNIFWISIKYLNGVDSK